MDLLNTINPVLTPGQRLLNVRGYEAAEKYPFPRDCQAALFDEDDDYVYIKSTDSNGGVTVRRFHLEEEPIPKFDPKKYVTVDDLAQVKEEMLNAINSIQQSISNSGYKNSQQGNGRGNGKSNSGSNESSTGVQ